MMIVQDSSDTFFLHKIKLLQTKNENSHAFLFMWVGNWGIVKRLYKILTRRTDCVDLCMQKSGTFYVIRLAFFT